jgi:hypothetical protein
MAGIPALLGVVFWMLRPKTARDDRVGDPVDAQLAVESRREPAVVEQIG